MLVHMFKASHFNCLKITDSKAFTSIQSPYYQYSTSCSAVLHSKWYVSMMKFRYWSTHVQVLEHRLKYVRLVCTCCARYSPVLCLAEPRSSAVHDIKQHAGRAATDVTTRLLALKSNRSVCYCKHDKQATKLRAHY
jgi:hypothetical protein